MQHNSEGMRVEKLLASLYLLHKVKSQIIMLNICSNDYESMFIICKDVCIQKHTNICEIALQMARLLVL